MATDNSRCADNNARVPATIIGSSIPRIEEPIRVGPLDNDAFLTNDELVEWPPTLTKNHLPGFLTQKDLAA